MTSNLLIRLNAVAKKLENFLKQISVLEKSIPQREAQIIELTNPKRPRLKDVRSLLTAAQFLSIHRTPQTLFPEQVEFLNELENISVRLWQNKNTINDMLDEVYYHIRMVEIRLELSVVLYDTTMVNYVQEVENINRQIEIELGELSEIILGE